ncbi:hypothetical protein V8C35DRAFT_286990 [Trichoderma chlorosporum]
MSSGNVAQKAAPNGVVLRRGTTEDIPAMLRLVDIATAWLVKKGQTGQWGTGRPSLRPAWVKLATELVETGETWIAVDTNAASSRMEDGLSAGEVDSHRDKSRKKEEEEELSIINGVVGALTVGEANSYAQPATEPELYIQFLASDRASSSKGVGTFLLDHARALAREAGVSQIRLDCYAGGSGGLVRYYESQGFERQETFDLKGWPGQVLMQRLDKEDEPKS